VEILSVIGIHDFAWRRNHRYESIMLFAHLKRILRLDSLRLRGPYGDRDEFHLAAAAQNLRKLAKLIPIIAPRPAWGPRPSLVHRQRVPDIAAISDFFSSIRQ
jgi:hypothetical protein